MGLGVERRSDRQTARYARPQQGELARLFPEEGKFETRLGRLLGGDLLFVASRSHHVAAVHVGC